MFTGLLFGVAVAAPVGPIGLLCLRRTLSGGFLIGFASGLGAACADGAYAALAAGAFDAAATVLSHFAVALRIGGGAALIVLGLRTAFAATRPMTSGENERATAPSNAVAAFASTLALTIVNPATIVSFAAIVVASSEPAALRSGVLLFAPGVLMGSAAWWLFLCGGSTLARRAITPQAMRAIDVISGAAFVLWGIRSAVGP
jgi:threonine/homoserine/homoserine lactone efflux protein